MSWLYYLLEANLYLVVFYAGYCLFLNKETYYTLNRVYLLLSSTIAFVLPLIQISALKPMGEVAQQTYTTVVPTTQQTNAMAGVNYRQAVNSFTWQDAVCYAYIIGIVVMTLLLVIKIVKLVKMTRGINTLLNNKYKLVGIEGSTTAFSFFNYLFIGTKINGSDTIIRHELVHIEQKHSADILFIELLRIINWFNPIIYFMQLSLKTVHEYIADEQTVAHETDAITYSSFLVNNAYGIGGPSITHSFFNYNLLKKRIIMLNQQRSGNLARLKYLVAVPICAGMLCASTLAFSKNYAFIDLAPNSDISALKTNNSAAALPARDLDPIKHITTPATENAFDNLRKLIAKHAHYPTAARESNTQGDVFALFSVDNNHKITNAKIVSGIEFGCGEDVIKQMPSFPIAVNVKPGTYKLKMSFSLAVDDSANPMPPAPPAKIAPFTADLEVVIVGYGSYPKSPTDAEKLKSTRLLPVDPQAVAVDTNNFQAVFGKYLARHIRYPAIARENRIQGKTIAVFDIVNGKIANLSLSKKIGYGIDDEIVRVFTNYTDPINVKPGKYSMPVSMVGASETGEDLSKPQTVDEIKAENEAEAGSTVLNGVFVTCYFKK